MIFDDFPQRKNSDLVPTKPTKGDFARRCRIRIYQSLFRNKTNAPYISGDSIASLTDYYVYGRSGNEAFDSSKLESANSVFVNSENLEDFFRNLKEFPSKSLVLVTGNSDRNFVSPLELPPQIKLWICQNNGMPKQTSVFTLPIGIENIRLGRLGLPKWYRSVGRKSISNKILVPPMSPTNVKRIDAVEFTSLYPEIFDVYTNYLHEKEYFDLTREYSFILCCEGNGFENHRIWETLYQGSFPVMLGTDWARSLSYLNLPILLVDSLSEVTPKVLRDFLVLNSDFNPKDCNPLWTSFWKVFIQTGKCPVDNRK
jgi:hypothetical protein